jgi:hypothetical protein
MLLALRKSLNPNVLIFQTVEDGSKWSAREVLDHVARDADELIGDRSDAALILDGEARRFSQRRC